jgi:hypothetical protein
VEGNMELFRIELTELNSFVRHHFQLYLGWYTFFLTVNFGAIGWFTSVLLTGALKVSLPILFIAGFFIIQLILSYMASREVYRYFATTHARSTELLAALGSPSPDEPTEPRSPIPVQVYLKIIRLICSTLISFIIFWLAISGVSLYLVHL